MDLSGYCLRMPLLTASFTGDARRRATAARSWSNSSAGFPH